MPIFSRRKASGRNKPPAEGARAKHPLDERYIFGFTDSARAFREMFDPEIWSLVFRGIDAMHPLSVLNDKELASVTPVAEKAIQEILGSMAYPAIHASFAGDEAPDRRFPEFAMTPAERGEYILALIRYHRFDMTNGSIGLDQPFRAEMPDVGPNTYVDVGRYPAGLTNWNYTNGASNRAQYLATAATMAKEKLELTEAAATELLRLLACEKSWPLLWAEGLVREMTRHARTSPSSDYLSALMEADVFLSERPLPVTSDYWTRFRRKAAKSVATAASKYA